MCVGGGVCVCGLCVGVECVGCVFGLCVCGMCVWCVCGLCQCGVSVSLPGLGDRIRREE